MEGLTDDQWKQIGLLKHVDPKNDPAFALFRDLIIFFQLLKTTKVVKFSSSSCEEISHNH